MSLEGNRTDDTAGSSAESSFAFRRWTRYGHDRIYCAGPDGTLLGHLDLATGFVAPSDGVDAEYLELLFHGWHHYAGISVPGFTVPETAASLVATPTSTTPATAAAPEGSPSNAELPLTGDLALNQPAQALVERADAEWNSYRERKPIVSRIAKVIGADTPDKNWRTGASGEREVARRLEQLTHDGWRILHSVPVGNRGSDIDHIVIGPPGVYCLNTKHHPGGNVWVADRMIMLNRHKTDYLRNSRHEAQRASRILTTATGWKIEVKPMIVIMGAQMTVKAQPSDVMVVRRRDIPHLFRLLPAQISDEAVDTIFNAARNPDIWV